MKKIKVDNVAELKSEFDRWAHIKEFGTSDPFWSDGVNLNLVRNHILYYKKMIEENEEAHTLIFIIEKLRRKWMIILLLRKIRFSLMQKKHIRSSHLIQIICICFNKSLCLLKGKKRIPAL